MGSEDLVAKYQQLCKRRQALRVRLESMRQEGEQLYGELQATQDEIERVKHQLQHAPDRK